MRARDAREPPVNTPPPLTLRDSNAKGTSKHAAGMLNTHANAIMAIPVAFKRAASLANDAVPSVAFNSQTCGSEP